MAKPQQATYINSFGFGHPGYATPEDLLLLENPAGSGKILRLSNMRLFLASTAATTTPLTFNFLRRSILNTGGVVAVSNTTAKMDSGQEAPAGVVKFVTAAMTLGTPAVNLAIQRANTTVLTGLGGNVLLVPTTSGISSGDTFISPFVLRPGECLAANHAGVALPAGFMMGHEIIWTETDIGS